MSEEQKSQPKPKSQGRITLCESKGSPPPEPVNVAPFLTEPKPIQKGLSPPPVEPVSISPFPAKPVPKANVNTSSSENTK